MPESNYETNQKDRNAKAKDAREFAMASKAGEAAESAAAKEKFQGFTAGGPVKSDPNEPKRADFPEGLGGQASYTKALKDYRENKTKKQSDSLSKASQ